MAILKNRNATEKPPLLCVDDIEERELSWLWYPYIPIGVATVIAGQGGIGKTTMACKIIAGITTGKPLPGQRKGGKPQKVLILSAEDDYGAVLRPRLRQCGANLKKIFVPDGTFTLDARGIRYISEYIRHIGVAVVFIDPLVAWMGGKIDMNRMNEVRSITKELHRIAQETQTAIVVVHHVRKGSNGEHWEQVAGSGDVVNAARSCLLVSRNKMGETFAHHFKHNYSGGGDDLYFTFEEGKFEWSDGPMIDGLEPGTPGRAPKAQIAAISFLKALLQDGPLTATDVEGLATESGINMRTLNRAKKGIAESFGKRVDGKLTWFWRLLPSAAGISAQSEKGDDRAGIPSMADGDDDDVSDRDASMGSAEDAGDGSNAGTDADGPASPVPGPRTEQQTTLIRDLRAEVAELLKGDL
jgi:DNA repair protein RadA/Sms